MHKPMGLFARDELRAALEKIEARTAKARADPGHNPNFQTQWAAHMQLVAVINFLQGDPQCEGRIADLHRLQEALYDIVLNGRRVRWLMPAPKAGAPRTGVMISNLRGRAAAVVEFLKACAGLTEKEAAKFVARYGAVQRLVPRGKQPLWRIVQDWRQQVIGHAEPSDQRDGFAAMLALIEKLGFGLSQASAQAEAKTLLTDLDAVDAS